MGENNCREIDHHHGDTITDADIRKDGDSNINNIDMNIDAIPIGTDTDTGTGAGPSPLPSVRIGHTPLNKAAQRGNLSSCRMILVSTDDVDVDHAHDVDVDVDVDGNNNNNASCAYECSYSLFNTVDDYGNTPLHSAASTGHDKIVQCLLDYGADYSIRNVYNLTPLQVASNKKCRDILLKAASSAEASAEASTSTSGFLKEIPNDGEVETEVNIRTKTESRNAAEMQNALYQEVKSKVLNAVTTVSSKDTKDQDDEDSLKRIIQEAEDFGMQEVGVIDKARECLRWLQVERKVQACIENVENESPFSSTAKNFQLVMDLQSTIEEICRQSSSTSTSSSLGDSSGDDDDKAHQQMIELPNGLLRKLEKGNELCSRSKSEIELYYAYLRLKDIECASKEKSSHVHLIDVLENAIKVAKEHSGDDTLIAEGTVVYNRLTAELDLQRAKESIPDVRLPDPNMTPKQSKAYFQPEEDMGYIQQTEEYPLPPSVPDGDGGDNTHKNEYIWIKSKSYQLLESSIHTLDDIITRSKECGCNVHLITTSEDALKQCRANLMLLEMKDKEDRDAAIVIAEKAAKKLLKKKQKGKGK